VIGDWMFNAYMAAKVVETIVPNGPAIVGNVSELFPVIANTLYSAAEPILAVNYSGLMYEYMPEMKFDDLRGNMTVLFDQMSNVTQSMKWE
jgi:hypothetical protein